MTTVAGFDDFAKALVEVMKKNHINSFRYGWLDNPETDRLNEE